MPIFLTKKYNNYEFFPISFPARPVSVEKFLQVGTTNFVLELLLQESPLGGGKTGQTDQTGIRTLRRSLIRQSSWWNIICQLIEVNVCFIGK